MGGIRSFVGEANFSQDGRSYSDKCVGLHLAQNVFERFCHTELPEQRVEVEVGHPEQGAGGQEELQELGQLISEDQERTWVEESRWKAPHRPV